MEHIIELKGDNDHKKSGETSSWLNNAGMNWYEWKISLKEKIYG